MAERRRLIRFEPAPEPPVTTSPRYTAGTGEGRDGHFEPFAGACANDPDAAIAAISSKPSGHTHLIDRQPKAQLPSWVLMRSRFRSSTAVFGSSRQSGFGKTYYKTPRNCRTRSSVAHQHGVEEGPPDISGAVGIAGQTGRMPTNTVLRLRSTCGRGRYLATCGPQRRQRTSASAHEAT